MSNSGIDWDKSYLVSKEDNEKLDPERSIIDQPEPEMVTVVVYEEVEEEG